MSVPTPTHPAPPELPEVPEGIEPAPPRPRWHPGVAVAGLVGTYLVAAVISGLVLALGGDLDDPPPAANAVALLVQDALVILGALVFANLAGRPRPSDFGLRPPRSWGSAFGWTLLVYVAFFAFTIVWLLALGADQGEDLPEELGAEDSTAAAIAIGAVVTIAAPIAEEIFFRGYLFGALRNWRGLWPAALLSGALFAGVHAGSSANEFLLPLAVLGAGLCILYAKTGSLYPPIMLHCFNNSLAYGTALGWGWQIPVLMAASLAVITLLLAAVPRR